MPNHAPYRRKAEESAENLRAILDTVIDAIVTIDERGIIISVNPATERIFGYTQAEMIGQNVSLLMPNPYREQHDQYLANYLASGEKKIIGIGREVTGLKKDGTTFPIDLAVSEVKSRTTRMFTGIIRDMTTRRETEGALIESERRLATLMSNLPGAAYRARSDCTWTIEFISDGCFDLTGYSPAQFLSGEVAFGRDLIHPDDKPDVSARVQWDLEDGRPFQAVYRIRHASKGVRWIWEQGCGVRNADGELEAIEGFLTDITEQNEAEEKLVQSERLAAIGQMVTGLAHESRNALQRARACLDMLSLDLSDQPHSIELARRVQSAIDELQRLYEEVREYASPINLSLSRCALADVWRSAWQNVREAASITSIRFAEEGADKSTDCRVDRYRIEQVFRNVFENALAVSPPDGVVNLQCSACEIAGQPAMEIVITDQGDGLPSEQIDRVFDPFYTTKQRGTGLGMPIAQRIIHSHGGTIQISSPPSGGAAVRIVIPRSLDRQATVLDE